MIESQKIYQYYQQLSEIPAVAGNEDDATWALQDWLETHCDAVDTDAMGNLICERRGVSDTSKKIMLVANIDTAGIVVTHVEDNGFVRFAPVGGLTVADLCNRRVRFAEDVYAIIACEGGTAWSEAEKSNLYLDFGVDSNVAVHHFGVGVGTFASLAGESYLQGDVICGAHLDNRMGCVALMLAMEQLQQTPRNHTVYFVFSVQGELGYRGAGAAAQPLQPDEVIAVGTTDTCDTPDAKRKGSLALGKGAAVKVMDKSMIANQHMIIRLRTWAHDVYPQLDVADSGTNQAGILQKIGKGAIAGGLSIPLRHRHSAFEMVHTKDVSDVISILTAYCKK